MTPGPSCSDGPWGTSLPCSVHWPVRPGSLRALLPCNLLAPLWGAPSPFPAPCLRSPWPARKLRGALGPHRP